MSPGIIAASGWNGARHHGRRRPPALTTGDAMIARRWICPGLVAGTPSAAGWGNTPGAGAEKPVKPAAIPSSPPAVEKVKPNEPAKTAEDPAKKPGPLKKPEFKTGEREL